VLLLRFSLPLAALILASLGNPARAKQRPVTVLLLRFSLPLAALILASLGNPARAKQRPVTDERRSSPFVVQGLGLAP
jgi:hypothetical protein